VIDLELTNLLDEKMLKWARQTEKAVYDSFK
jgi:hypothetical protein